MKGSSNAKEKNAAGKQNPLDLGYDAPFRGFVNVDLTPAQKEAFSAWYEDTDIEAWMAVLCADGIVLSVKRDKKGNGFVASATQRREASVNAGLATTARAGDPASAFQRLLYVVALLPEGDWEKSSIVRDNDPW